MAQPQPAPAPGRQSERKAPALAAVGEAYLAGRRRPISELSPEQQEQIREAYADTGFVPGDCQEFFGISTDYETARAKAAQYDGGFVISLPVGTWKTDNLTLPDVQAQPRSSDPEFYDAVSLGIAPVSGVVLAQMAELTRQGSEHTQKLQALVEL